MTDKVEELETYNALYDGAHFHSPDYHHDEDDHHVHVDEHHEDPDHDVPKATAESMDFEAVESVMWRKHQLRRFFQDRGHWWTSKKKATTWKWVLVVIVGIAVGLTGSFVQILTEACIEWKFETARGLYEKGDFAGSFFAFVFCCLFLAGLSGFLCWHEPAAAGSGIPEIKAFLNGVNYDKAVRFRVVVAKVFGMCFSCAAGLPLGKEGPMIHAGSIIGAACSLGQTITFGFDSSWQKFQDFRNDRSKLDFVAIGAAAGIGAAFRAPIGGVLFTLEEGASFWSNTLTIRSFVCAMITMLTVSLVFAGPRLGRGESAGIFTFGQFDNLEENKTNFYTYELFLFAIMGVLGGALGALFNYLNMIVTIFRMKHVNHLKWKRFIELLLVTGTMAIICFVVSLMWVKCTKIPNDTSFMTQQELHLLDELVQFQCEEGEYNQVASLFMASADTAMRQLMHFREFNGTNYATFEAGPLIMFFIPYFLMASITAGTLCPAGLFVPTLLAGAAYGRLWGHIMNSIAPGYVADSGTYALIGAAAVLGGMARMTIAGTVIILEAAGNIEYLLPLMVTFVAARYAGNAINLGMYEIQIELKKMPFLKSTLQSLGLLSFYPVTEIMTHPVTTFREVEKVGWVYNVLKSTNHNAFPITGKTGYIRGLAMRKTLCTLLKLKAFSTPNKSDKRGIQVLTPAATVFYDTLERSYPRFTKIDDISLSDIEMNLYLDMRPYMDTAPYCINQSASVQRCYRLFRTMGLRHLIVVDSTQCVIGILTRKDITKHRLQQHWFVEGHNLQKFINVEPLAPACIVDNVYDESGGEGMVSGPEDNGLGVSGNGSSVEESSDDSNTRSMSMSAAIVRQHSSSGLITFDAPDQLRLSPLIQNPINPIQRHSVNLFGSATMSSGGLGSSPSSMITMNPVLNPAINASSDDSNDSSSHEISEYNTSTVPLARSNTATATSASDTALSSTSSASNPLSPSSAATGVDIVLETTRQSRTNSTQ